MNSSPTERCVEPGEVAARLAGEPITSIELLSRSGNNRLFRVGTHTARFALKWYASASGADSRLNREYAALRFLNANGAGGHVPAVIACDPANGFALYEWIEGTPLATHDERDIDAALGFLACAHAARTAAGAHALAAATEACLSLDTLVRQVDRRIAHLRQISEPDAELDDFLGSAVIPSFAYHRAAATSGAADTDDIDPAARTLSPSDFSFHNALRRSDGSLVFLDFEYFGWDDPVKLVSDFLWHPAMRIDPDDAARFVTGARAIFGAGDRDFSRRLRARFPLFGLKWCLIVLNEFLPEHWRRRQFAGEPRPWAAVKAAQLHKARAIMSDVVSGSRGAVCA